LSAKLEVVSSRLVGKGSRSFVTSGMPPTWTCVLRVLYKLEPGGASVEVRRTSNHPVRLAKQKCDVRAICTYRILP
jgi:hypothetical protein